MKIIDNPNPISTKVITCKECKCTFEYTDKDIVKENKSTANGRLGGRHYFQHIEYLECPNCKEKIVFIRKSGYGSSSLGDYHITEDYHI